MPDLETRFRGLHRVRGPDLWPDIETRQPRPTLEGGPTRRVAAAAVALALAAGGAVLVARAFLGSDRVTERPARPVATPPAPVDPVVDVTLPIEWPSSIVYGEGSIWVAASANDGTGAGTVYRIDPDTAGILAETDVPTVPGWEVGGGGMEVAEGSLWIAGYLDEGSQGALVRIDADTNEVGAVYPLGGDFAGDVAVDEHGIWISLFSEPSVELARVERAPLVVDLRTSLGVNWAREILAVRGTVWVRVRLPQGEPEEAALLRIDPVSGTVIDQVSLGSGVTSATTDGEWIWVTDWNRRDGNLLLRVHPLTGDVMQMPSGSLEQLAEAGESGLWGSGRDLETDRPGIVRFDPESMGADASVGLEQGQSPIALAVAPGSVWTVSYEEGVTRIELRPA
jgi:hypothetical protein